MVKQCSLIWDNQKTSLCYVLLRDRRLEFPVQSGCESAQFLKVRTLESLHSQTRCLHHEHVTIIVKKCTDNRKVQTNKKHRKREGGDELHTTKGHCQAALVAKVEEVPFLCHTICSLLQACALGAPLCQCLLNEG